MLSDSIMTTDKSNSKAEDVPTAEEERPPSKVLVCELACLCGSGCGSGDISTLAALNLDHRFKHHT